jgi:predicted transcriptional regulator
MPDSDDKALVAQILSSYFANNNVAADDLPSVIELVKRAFNGGAEPVPVQAAEVAPQRQSPATSIKKSVSYEAITCLCCGAKFKSLKRHLLSAHQLSPYDYRAAFDLKSDYPFVAPAYAARRSDLAKSLALGRKPAAKSSAKKAAPKRRRAKKAVAA